MKKYDIGYKLIMTAVWGLCGWVVWCLCTMVRITAAPNTFFRFLDDLTAGFFVLMIITVWSETLKKRREILCDWLLAIERSDHSGRSSDLER